MPATAAAERWETREASVAVSSRLPMQELIAAIWRQGAAVGARTLEEEEEEEERELVVMTLMSVFELEGERRKDGMGG